MLNKLASFYKKVEKMLASLKFAVIIIAIFNIFLIIGTFVESFNGAEYAQKVIYKSLWFMGIQGLMFLSILCATLVRLPPKKALYGFYVIHAGLITLFLGSYITYVNGVDGQLELIPGRPSNRIILPEDILKIHYVSEGQSTLLSLPYTAFAKNMDFKYRDVTVTKYLPSADTETVWVDSQMDENTIDHSTTYNLSTENFGQEFTVALNPNSDFQSMTKLGLLNVHYMPENLYECFIKPSKSGYVIWNLEDNSCFTPEERGIEPQKTDKDNEFVAFKHKDEWLKFFPNFSPLPLNDDLTKREDADFRIFSRKLFEDKPTLFLFGEKLAHYSKRRNAWIGKEFKSKDDVVTLPWMGLQIRVVNHVDRKYPILNPIYTKPVHDNGNVIHGAIKAVQVKMGGEFYWVRSDQPLVLSTQGEEVRFQLIQKELLLPYELNLDRFKMDTDPGTKNPASYESFVTVFDGRTPNTGSETYHVYMNNPLKYDGFTFYQASYFQTAPDAYASVLSVNFDPGRPIKYLGSLLLVLGSIWHYMIRRKKKTKFFSRENKKNSSSGEENA